MVKRYIIQLKVLLNENDLKQIVNKIGHRKKILKYARNYSNVNDNNNGNDMSFKSVQSQMNYNVKDTGLLCDWFRNI